ASAAEWATCFGHRPGLPRLRDSSATRASGLRYWRGVGLWIQNQALKGLQIAGPSGSALPLRVPDRPFWSLKHVFFSGAGTLKAGQIDHEAVVLPAEQLEDRIGNGITDRFGRAVGKHGVDPGGVGGAEHLPVGDVAVHLVPDGAGLRAAQRSPAPA